MDIFITGIFIFALSIILFSFINIGLSVALYISYLILVPYLQFHFSGVSLSYNLVNTLLLLNFLYYFKRKHKNKLSFKVIIPFLFLFAALLFLSLFSWGMPWGIQFNSWRVSFMQTCLVSFIIWNFAYVDKKILVYLKWALIISLVIAGVYGLFLMKMEGLNPYTTLLSNYFGVKDAAEVYANATESRLNFSTAGKIQATMVHPMTWTLILDLTTLIFVSFYIKTKNKFLLVLLALNGFGILISGVRTGIAALLIGYFYFLFKYRKIKLLVVTIITISALAVVIQYNDDLSNLANSFVDVTGQKSEVKGSSIALRIEQLHGALNEIKGHELTGKGYDWTNYYQSINGDHPVLLAFESLLFVIICNSGIFGLLIWVIFFLLLYKLNRRILTEKVDILLIDMFIIVYVAYAVGTGEYGYIKFFSILYTILITYLAYYQNNINKKISDFKKL